MTPNTPAQDSYIDTVDDLQILLFFHLREPANETVEMLRWAGVCNLIQGCRDHRAMIDAARLMESGLATPSKDLIDDLATEHAAIYVTHAYRAAPCESVWFDEEGLTQQAPMFMVRDWMHSQGVVPPDDGLPEDHLVNELRFVIHLLTCRPEDGGAVEAGRFMDRHLLSWLPWFVDRLDNVRASPFYRGLAQLTLAYLVGLRDRIALQTGLAKPDCEEIKAFNAAKRRVGHEAKTNGGACATA